MVEPVITTGAAIVGASAWFLNRVLGPSFDALGDQLKLYASGRINAIFKRAEEVADPNKIEAIPPGFAIQFLQKASYSPDSEEITDMWAGLLADAASGTDHRHNIFVDILSQIGPQEAAFLNSVFPKYESFRLIEDRPEDLRSTLFEKAKGSIDWASPKAETDARRVVDHLLGYDFGWPVLVQSASHYWPDDIEKGYTNKLRECRPSPNSFVIDALSRQKLIEYFDIDFHPGWASPRFDGYFMTSLGVDFVLACRGPSD